MKTLYLTLFFFFILYIFSYSQNYNHEIGIFTGATSMQTDYKERENDLVGPYRNTGFTIGFAYYLSFDSRVSKWNNKTEFLKNHFRLKLDANYVQNSFVHRGKSIYSNSNPVDAVKMAELKGNTKLYNFGAHIEYLILDSYNDYKFEPYLVGGAYYTIYNPDLESELGDWKDNPTLLPDEYLNGSINLNSSIANSVAFGFGTRYNVGNLTLFAELKTQKFLSDEIEGLKPRTGENKNRDWLSTAQFGVIFKIN